MKNYFLAPRSGEKPYKNFESTIKNGIPFERISKHLNDAEKSILTSESVIYAWGNREGTKSAWEKMNIGDTVIFYAHKFLVMAGEVYLKKHSPELALSMWPADDNGNPWEYTFFIKNLKYISIPIQVFNNTVGYLPNNVVQGFTYLNSDRIKRIESQYGSVEAMLDIFKDDYSHEAPSVGEKVYVNLPHNIIPLVIENRKFKPHIISTNNGKKLSKKKIDYLLKNKINSLTGSTGEEIVLKRERDYLHNNGRPDLAEKIKRVSLDDDTLGYDILSYDLEGNEKYIEVKSTINRDSIKFFVTINEYKVGKNNDKYYIYFVENINSETPKITIIKNPIDPSQFTIEPNGFIFSADII